MSTPEIITVNSEALESTIRDLLPSQRGFGSELQATNVITPIIDLTPTAEGSILRDDLQKAFTLDSITAFNVEAATTTVLTGTGFYRFIFTVSMDLDSGANRTTTFKLKDASTTKELFGIFGQAGGNPQSVNIPYDFIVFLDSGQSVEISTSSECRARGSFRQIATINGTLVQPAGFVAE
jgi:hypothetical protein